MPIVCVIPARFNSIRFPGKLLVEVDGKTVLQRTFEQALNCPDIEQTFIATDDVQIAEHVRFFGGEVLWTSQSCKNGTERIGEAVRKTPELQNASLIVNLQGDHPTVKSATLSAIIQLMQSDPEASMATAAAPIAYGEELLSPHTVKCVFDRFSNALYFSRSPIPYGAKGGFGHIGIYCYRPAFLLELLETQPTFLQESEDLEQLKVLENGHRVKIALVDEIPLGIDVPGDIAKLKRILCLQNTFS